VSSTTLFGDKDCSCSDWGERESRQEWFEAKNGPNGEFLIALCRHSDQVLETFCSSGVGII